MSSTETNTPTQEKKKQALRLWVGVGLATLLVSLGVWLGTPSRETKIAQEPGYPAKSFTTGTDRLNPQERYLYQIEENQKLNAQQIKTLQQGLEQVVTLLQTQQQTAQADVPSVRQALSQAVQGETPSVPNPQAGAMILPPPPTSSGTEKKNSPPPGIAKISFTLQNPKSQQTLKTADNTIPAGTFVSGILLSGVDASTSIQASSDPRPVLVRLMDAGTLPRKFHSDLDDCHLLAAATGDLSSERVLMRLEKMTCMERRTGEILEMDVKGYIAGEDGRAGVRGNVVDRAGESMRHAMIGGFVSSMGNFLSQSRDQLTFAPGTGIAIGQKQQMADLLKRSAASGTGGALEKYADFYIKRAEQMQPVIQVAAGRMVDIVFIHGVPFGDSLMRHALSKTHDKQRLQQAQQVSEPKPVEHWLPKNPGDAS